MSTFIEANSAGDTNGSCSNADELGYVTFSYLAICNDAEFTTPTLLALGAHGAAGTAAGTLAVKNTVDLEGVSASKSLCTDTNKLIAACSSFNQPSANTTGGTCSMSTGTTCTITLGHTYSTPVCIATEQGTSATVIAAACSVSGTTLTITAASSNSATWGAWAFGNPN